VEVRSGFDIDWPCQPGDQDSHSVAAAVDYSHRSQHAVEEEGCCSRRVLPAVVVCCTGHIAAGEGTRIPAVERIPGCTDCIEVEANTIAAEDHSCPNVAAIHTHRLRGMPSLACASRQQMRD